MRFPVALVLLFAAAGLNACSTERQNRTLVATATPTGSPTVTVAEVMVGAEELPGCKLDREAQVRENHYSRSFACELGDRLTLDFIVHKSMMEAEKLQDVQWSTLDGATDLIRASIQFRPVSQQSLAVTNAKQSFGKLGADQENIYCATFTDPSGAVMYTQYFGALRHKSVVVQYTSWAQSAGSCDGPSRTLDRARVLATRQLARLKTTVP